MTMKLAAPLDPERVVRAMGSDKKNRGGQIHFALPATLGRMHRLHGWTTAVPDAAIRRVLALSNAG